LSEENIWEHFSSRQKRPFGGRREADDDPLDGLTELSGDPEFEQGTSDSAEGDGEGEGDMVQGACDLVLWYGELSSDDTEFEQQRNDSADGDGEKITL